MKKNVNKNTLLLFVFLAVVFSLTSFLLSLFPAQNAIQSGATSQTTTLSIIIVDSDEEQEVDEEKECHKVGEYFLCLISGNRFCQIIK